MIKIILLIGLLTIAFECNVNAYPFLLSASASSGTNNESGGNITNLINQIITHKTTFLSNFLRALSNNPDMSNAASSTPNSVDSNSNGQNNGNSISGGIGNLINQQIDKKTNALNQLRPTTSTVAPNAIDTGEDNLSPSMFNAIPTQSTIATTSSTTESSLSSGDTTTSATTSTTSSVASLLIRTTSSTTSTTALNPTTSTTSSSIETTDGYEYSKPSTFSSRFGETTDEEETTITPTFSNRIGDCDTLLPGHKFPLPPMWVACPE